ncbi:retrovirus-related pol polyprotein from transposon TNT 1-94 [Tanacetum coccineum]
MIASSLICLLSKASKTKSWLWHRRLSHLKFGTINHLARNGLVLGLPKLKCEKDHMCSACAMGKSKKQSHKPKSEDTNQKKQYLLHIDLYGHMRVASINGKKYILIIIDDYSQFTWMKFLASKDEAPDFIIKFLKMIQVRLNAPIKNIRTDNGTEFVNQTLRSYYESVGYLFMKHCCVDSPQQNGVVERRNRTLVEAARTIKPDVSYLYVFGALCYPNNDSEDLAKLEAKADIGPGLQFMTPATSSSGLFTNLIPQQPCNPPPRDDWDRLFQPIFDEYFNPPTIVVSLVPVANAPRVVDLADSPVSTSIDQDATSTIEPKNFKQAMTKPSWVDAMQEETHEFERLQVWGLVPCKRKELISKESFAPVTRIEEHPFFVANAASEYDDFQMELNTDFFKCASQGRGHMFLNPKDCRIRITHLMGYKLKKALYGLKQAPRAWYYMLLSFLLSQHFSKGAVDPTLFIRKAGNDLLLVQIYVDDIIFASTNTTICNEFTNLLTTKFKMSIMGHTLVEKNKLDEDLQGTPIDATLYRGMIGSIMYLTSSRHDLIYAVCLCARYQAKPTKKHLNAEVPQFLGDKLVSWSSKKQKSTAISNYGFQFNMILLYYDNKSTIALCCNNVQHSRAKHIDVRYHYIKEQVKNGIVELYFVRMEYQLDDIFTKPLPRERFNFLAEKLGKRSMSLEMLKCLTEEEDE